jgi:hypothetical protein
MLNNSLLLLGELKKGEAIASLLNIHGGDIHVVPTHLVLFSLWRYHEYLRY